MGVPSQNLPNTEDVFSISCKYLKQMGFLDVERSETLDGGGFRKISKNISWLKIKSGYSREEQSKFIKISWLEDLGNNRKYEALYYLDLVSSKCNYGGNRWRFICPNRDCRKQVDILYFSKYDFQCRVCAKLRYRSQEIELRTKRGRYSKLILLGKEIAERENTHYKSRYRGTITRTAKRLSKIKNLSERLTRYFRQDEAEYGTMYAITGSKKFFHIEKQQERIRAEMSGYGVNNF